MHKCTNNISLYCGFKELSVKGLKTANKHCVLHNAVSYLNKGPPSSYLGRENNNTLLFLFKTSQGVYTLPRKNIVFAQIHKSPKGMLLQYSGAALVRDADIEMVK